MADAFHIIAKPNSSTNDTAPSTPEIHYKSPQPSIPPREYTYLCPIFRCEGSVTSFRVARSVAAGRIPKGRLEGAEAIDFEF